MEVARGGPARGPTVAYGPWGLLPEGTSGLHDAAMKSLGLAAFLLVAACHPRGVDSTACTGEAEPAVVVHVLGPASGATVVLREGAYQETLMEVQAGEFRGGFERAGTYRVEISATGFASQAVDGVVAAQLACGPDTQTLTITLQPSPQPALLLLPDADGVYHPLPGTLRPTDEAAFGPEPAAIDIVGRFTR